MSVSFIREEPVSSWSTAKVGGIDRSTALSWDDVVRRSWTKVRVSCLILKVVLRIDLIVFKSEILLISPRIC